ncbi:MAG: amino acid adenylation domain-containing protein [Terriglobia bacterium]
MAVGTLMAGRNRAETEGLIGFFVNTVVLRTDMGGNPSFRELLGRVKEVALGAYAHPDLPFEKLVEELQPERDLSRNPLVQVTFQLYNPPNLGSYPRNIGETAQPASTPQLLDIKKGTAKFDLALEMWEGNAGLEGRMEYSTDLFEASTVRRMLGHFERLLRGIAENPGERIDSFPLLSEAEVRQQAFEWNRTGQVYPRDMCIHQLFQAQVEKTPNAPALICGSEEWTYGALNQRANHIAHYLRTLGVKPDTVTGVCLERSPKLVAAVLGILKAGGAYLPLDPNYPKSRLEFMVKDAEAAVIVSDGRLGANWDLTGSRIVDIDAISANREENPATAVIPQNLAYVLYTSGSTGWPKGVAIEHQSAVALIHWGGQSYSAEELGGVLASTSICFDLSVFELFVPLCFGGSAILVDSALALPQAPQRDRVTLINAVPSAIAELVKSGGIPNSVRTLNLAGEPLGSALVDLIFFCSGAEQIFNLYGPTEDTTYSTSARITRDARWAPTIGRPIANKKAYILDRKLRPVPVGVTGELHLSGDGLMRGYLNRPELNNEKLLPSPYAPGARLYKTGDLARYRENGEIEFIGRSDQQVKLRGFRIELGEIETAIRSYPNVREAVVLLRQDAGVDPRLVAYIIPRADSKLNVANVADVQRTLAQALPQYMIPSVMMILDDCPMTPSGKVDRQALPAPEVRRIASQGSRMAPRTEVERTIARAWLELLPVSEVTRSDNFFELGGHSLLILRLQSKLTPLIGELPIVDLFRYPTIEALAKHISEDRGLGGHFGTAVQQRAEQQKARAKVRERASALRTSGAGRTGPPQTGSTADRVLALPEQKREALKNLLPGAASSRLPVIHPRHQTQNVPLSFGQERLWFRDQWEPGCPAYNMPTAVRLDGPVDVGAVERALAEILRRHEALRTKFRMCAGNPVQDVSPETSPEFRVITVSAPGHQRMAELARLAREETVRPFNLSQGPLFRATLFLLDEAESVLLMVMHHIAGDGWSVGVLSHEFVTIYNAHRRKLPSPLPELPIQYTDFALWQRESLNDDYLGDQLAYWEKQLADAPPLELPFSRPRPPASTHRGAQQRLAVPADLRTRLQMLSRSEGVTMNMTLLAAFKVLLHRYSGQDDIVVGGPVAGRSRPETERLIGFFVNTLVMRTDLSGEPAFRECLHRVRKVVLEALMNQEAPFERLVKALNPDRDLSRNPLFQVTFQLFTGTQSGQYTEPPALDLSVMGGRQTSVFDLAFNLWESSQGVDGCIEYSTDVFDGEYIARMAEHFLVLLGSIVANPDGRIGDLPLLTRPEREEIVLSWNDTHSPDRDRRSIQEMIEAHALLSPDRCAVMGGCEALTYEELNRRANRIAHHLRTLGVRAETVVAVCLNPSPDLLAVLLGILKAGGAYVPIDPSYPPERIGFMERDVGAIVLVTRESLRRTLPATKARVVCIDHVPDTPDGNPAVETTPDTLAYIIYTSGSTGVPKGVEVEHRALRNLIDWHRRAHNVTSLDRATQIASISFDAAVWEIWPYLASGATICIADEDTRSDPQRILAWLVEQRITICFLPTPLAEAMLRLPLPSGLALRELLTGGDRLHYWPDAALPFRFSNHYGPTENAVVTTFAFIEADDRGGGNPPIGRPISNNQLYILDKNLNPVPVGIPGEIYIGGDSLARGYHNRPDLTAERFVSNPFDKKDATRLYKSGDVARFRPDGNVEFLGRNDGQVKIRGFRVERGEIEAVLSDCPGICEAVVIAREDAPGGKQLVAYYVRRPHEECPDLRQYLKNRLPGYMIPSTFVELDFVPVTVNGKIDTRGLPKPEAIPKHKRDGTPRNAVEKVLAGLWAEVLQLDSVGIHDDFFVDHGGHSLLSISLVSRIREALQVEVPLRAIFEAPTVRGLAERLLADAAEAPRILAVAELFLHVLRMPASEIEGFLGRGEAREFDAKLT